MSLSNLNELEDKIKKLNDLLIKEDNHAYAAGYLQSMFTRIIKSYVPAQRHHEVISLIDTHIYMIEDDAYNKV